MNEDDDYQDDVCDEDMEDSNIMLCFNNNGEVTIYNPEDYVDIRKEEAELLKDFINEHKEMFDDWVKKVMRG